MKVVVGGQVWLPKSELSAHHITNIKRQLTIQPRRTTDIQAKEDPKPIFLFSEDEKNGLLGVPRGYYLARKNGEHEEVLDISYGAPMRDLSNNRFSCEGPYREQGVALEELEAALGGRPWGSVFLRAKPGFGKALAHGEPVFAKDGYVPIEELSVGDRVAGIDGKFYCVTGVFPQGERELFRVTFSDGTHVDCDGDHLWTWADSESGELCFTVDTRFVAKALGMGVEHRVFCLPELEARFVTSVEPMGKGLATCISVDSPNSLFLTRNRVPTHNTITGLELCRRLGRRTLILVHKTFLMKQWQRRIEWLMPDAKVGIIRQSTCEYDVLKDGESPDFVIALNQSLAKDDGTKYPGEMYNEFGTIVSDEVHRIGAGTWSDIIPRFNAAYRIGLSATVTRKDGADNVFNYHISPVTYSAKTHMARPKLRKIITSTKLKAIERGEYRVSADNLNNAQILSQICEDEFRTRQIVDDLVLGVKAKRKIMVGSDRLMHLKKMAEMLSASLFNVDLGFVPKIDFYTGEWFTGEAWEKTVRNKSGKILHRKGELKTQVRTEEELRRAESANVIFGTWAMVQEGLDIPSIDVMVLATPPPDIEQALGREQRWCVSGSANCEVMCPWRAGVCKVKPQPILTEVIDAEIPKLLRKWKRRRTYYESLGMI